MPNAKEVKGFDKLTDADAELFDAFMNNWYPSLGPESQRTFVPLEVKVIESKGSGTYLRFDFERLGIKSWLHVIGPWKWF